MTVNALQEFKEFLKLVAPLLKGYGFYLQSHDQLRRWLRQSVH